MKSNIRSIQGCFKFYASLILLFSLMNVIHGQAPCTDFELIRTHSASFETEYGDNKEVGARDSIKVIHRIILLPVKLYQKTISPQFSSNCQFNPSCSVYSSKLIQEFGLLKGIFLAADRLTRCNEISLIDVPNFKISSIDYKVHEDCSVYKWHK